MSIYGFNGKNKTFDKGAFAAEKKKQREDAFALVDKTLEAAMADRDKFRDYLHVQGQFDRYSVNNALLVAAQMPSAKLLRSKHDWSKDGIKLRKGARKLLILDPHKYTKTDGSMATGYNVKEVYDISQTDEAAGAAMEETLSARTIVRALIEAAPVTVKSVVEQDRDAYYDRERREILVRKGLPEEQLIAALAREACNAVYDIKLDEDAGMTMKPVCAAYMVCVGCGIDSEKLSAVIDPQTLGAEDKDEFKDILYGMREVNRELQANMYRTLHRSAAAREEQEHEERA